MRIHKKIIIMYNNVEKKFSIVLLFIKYYEVLYIRIQ